MIIALNIHSETLLSYSVCVCILFKLWVDVDTQYFMDADCKEWIKVGKWCFLFPLLDSNQIEIV